MTSRPLFSVIFAPEVIEHLRAIERKHHRLIRTSIHEGLQHTPGLATRNRKPLHQPAPFGAAWELRCGPKNQFRVFYDVHEDAKIVVILAVGVKTGNRLRVGVEEFMP